MLDERVEEMLGEVESMRDSVRSRQMQRDTVQEGVETYDTDIGKLEELEIQYGKATEVFKTIADDRNEEAKAALEDVLSWALGNIELEQRYEAYIEEMESKRSGKEMTIVLRDLDTGRERKLKNQTGTAISQIVSFLMNMIAIKFSGASRILVIDEVLSGLHDVGTVRMFGEIMVALAKNEDFQIILVEHERELGNVEGIERIHLALEDYEKGLQVNKNEN